MNLSELCIAKNVKNIDELLDKELSDIKDIRYKTQKKVLAQKLNNLFDGYFLDNYRSKNYGNFLSRALTAYTISKKFDIPIEEAATYITDDNHDFGLDAIYCYNNKIFVFQTKFSPSLKRKDIAEIKDGLRMLLSLEDNIDKFNIHIQHRTDEIRRFLLVDDIQIIPILIFLGNQVSSDVMNFMEQEIKHNKEYGEFIGHYEIINNEKIFDYEVAHKNITCIFTLDKFFTRTKPVAMYAGCIKVSFLKVLYQKYGDALFSKNIRLLVEDSNINKGIKDTLINEPENFLYYNNGITFICDKISTLADSASSSNIKNLKIENMSIVNGAQTVLSSASVENISDQALVQVRIIEASEGASQNNNLSLMITKFNNSQNSVSAMDLRTLDSIHIEIKKFFIKHGQYYFYKTGETQNKDKYITFEDLMISLGCFYEQSQTVKQNKGELWSNTKLYNDLLKTKDLQLYLLLCLVKKQVDIDIQKYIKQDGFLVHWNRLILELVYKKLDIQRDCDFETIKNKIDPQIKQIANSIIKYIEENNKYRNIFHRQSQSYQELKDYIINGKTNEHNNKQMIFDF